MLKLDRNFSQSGNFKDFKRESDNYLDLSFEKRSEIFAYLQSVAYNYVIGKSPKLDRAVHSKR